MCILNTISRILQWMHTESNIKDLTICAYWIQYQWSYNECILNWISIIININDLKMCILNPISMMFLFAHNKSNINDLTMYGNWIQYPWCYSLHTLNPISMILQCMHSESNINDLTMYEYWIQHVWFYTDHWIHCNVMSFCWH